MNDRIGKLNLTHPEKAIIVVAMALFSTGDIPLIDKANSYFIDDIKLILSYPGISDILILACDESNVLEEA